LGNVIAGTGMFVPDNVVTNHDLTRIMDASEDRITSGSYPWQGGR